jgi:hypothetical protein
MGRVQVEKFELLGFEPGEFFDYAIFLVDIGRKDLKWSSPPLRAAGREPSMVRGRQARQGLLGTLWALMVPITVCLLRIVFLHFLTDFLESLSHLFGIDDHRHNTHGFVIDILRNVFSDLGF